MLRPLHRPAQYLPWTNFCNRFLMVCCQNTTTQSEINFVDFTLMDFVWSSRVWFFQKRGGIGGKLWENPCRCMLQLCYVISTCFFWVKISMFQCMERNPIRGLRVRWKLRSPKSNAFQTMSQWWVVERVFESICRDILGVRSLRVCFFQTKCLIKHRFTTSKLFVFVPLNTWKWKTKNRVVYCGVINQSRKLVSFIAAMVYQLDVNPRLILRHDEPKLSGHATVHQVGNRAMIGSRNGALG